MIPFINNRLPLIIVFVFIFFSTAFSQDAPVVVDSAAVLKGEQIFKANCTSCHVMGDKKLIGPGLLGVTDRRTKEWLKKWINSSSDFIASGDADAIAIYEEYNKVAMPSYYFEDADYEAVYAYLKNPPVKVEVLDTGDLLAAEDEGIKTSTQLMFIGLFLLLLVYLLTSLKNKLKASLKQETETISETLFNQFNLFISNNRNVVFVVVASFIVVVKFSFDTLSGVGVYTKYQPEQPIAFSHKVHAGENGVDCNYCHTSARKSKHSGIPSANVCMNCHTYINEGTITGTTEISKIYEAVGFDPDSKTYIEGYEQQPIKWVRIHNLPDLSYFNHSQHVVAGKVECQTCHGPIEEMDVVYQHAELTMGWCIDCHRTTEVAMEGNEYYTELHAQLKEKYKGQKITVDKIGGIECGKCHY
jgi:mono/diheme cytochrome c family protein|tara:strand:+ start:1741 stop:2985 length:1245 start_codon:yes stop_codon:yes gene_type:complete